MKYSWRIGGCALLIAVSLLGGCGTRVGGPCSYEQHAGIAEVISLKEGEYQLRFHLLPELVAGTPTKTLFPLERLNGWEFQERSQNPALMGAVAGTRYQTTVSVMTEGSCNPVSFKIGSPISGH